MMDESQKSERGGSPQNGQCLIQITCYYALTIYGWLFRLLLQYKYHISKFAPLYLFIFDFVAAPSKQTSLVEADPRGIRLRRLSSAVRCVQQQRPL